MMRCAQIFSSLLMARSLRLVVFFSLLFASASGFVAAQESIKVAVVNVAHLMDKAPQADAASEALKARFLPREKVLMVERDLLQSEEDNLSRNTQLSQDERIKKERELRERRRTYTRDLEDFREDLAVARSAALDNVQQKVFDAIAEVAQERNIDLVGQDFIYASKRVDITAFVLQYLRNDFQRSQQEDDKNTTKTENKESLSQ